MGSLLDETYVINLDSDVHRLETFDSMMKSSNWHYTRHPAINGKKIMKPWPGITLTDEGEKLLNLKNKYVGGLNWLSKTEIGCLLSHVTLWEEVATNPKINRIAIFEDDARTHVDGNTVQKLLREFYDYLESQKIPEPDMLYLGKSLDDCINYEKVWGNIYKSRHPLCLHAYIINKQGAQKLLKLIPYSYAVDIIPIKAIEKGLLNVMAFHPSIYFQDMLNNVSNLRSLRSGINNTTECLVSQQHVTGETWEYVIIIIIALIAAIILFIIFMWLRPWQ